MDFQIPIKGEVWKHSTTNHDLLIKCIQGDTLCYYDKDHKRTHGMHVLDFMRTHKPPTKRGNVMENTIDFIECDTCRAKCGSPVLCEGCLNNRRLISELQQKLEKKKKKKPQTNKEDKEPIVKLTIYEWHLLLGELQHALRICNRDNSKAEHLYQKIGEQLNDKEC